MSTNPINPQTIATQPEIAPEKENTNSLFKELKKSLKLYREEEQALAFVQEEGVFKTYRLNSPAFNKYLRAFAFNYNGRGIGQTAAADMVDTLEAIAMSKEGQSCQISQRFTRRGDVSYLDLCNDAWQAIKITQYGWEVINAPAPLFVRGGKMRPLPLPVPCTDITQLWQFFNLPNEQDRLLLRTWLLTAMLGEGINPAIVFHGEQGSAKSTSTRLLRALIDPNRSELRALPRDERDLFVAAQANPILAFDNMSGVTKGMSDALCRIITGGSYSTRKLHSDSEEMLLEGKAHVILNGIDDIAARQDLIERAIIITLPPIPPHKRKPEEVFQQEFKEAHPLLLGALLHDLHLVIKLLPSMPKQNLPRMTTFARVGMALSQAYGHEPESFLTLYAQNSRAAVDVGLEAEPVAEAVERFMAKREGIYRTPMAGFYHELNHACPSLREGFGWPKTAHNLSGILRRLAPALRQKGIDVNFEKTEAARWVIIQTQWQKQELPH